MKFNTEGLYDIVKLLNDFIKHMDNARDGLRGIKIPAGLNDINVRLIADDLYLIENDVKGIKSWLKLKTYKLIDVDRLNGLLINQDMMKYYESLILKFDKKGKGTQNIDDREALMDIIRARLIGNDEFLKYFADRTGHYGSDQAFLRKIVKDNEGKAEYIRLLNVLKTKYKMKTKDAVTLMRIMKNNCSYGAATDVITAAYALYPDKFYDKFGFQLYIERDDGNIRINSGEILLDLFIRNNLQRNGEGVLRTNSDGHITISPDSIKYGTIPIGYIESPIMRTVKQYLSREKIGDFEKKYGYPLGSYTTDEVEGTIFKFSDEFLRRHPDVNEQTKVYRQKEFNDMVIFHSKDFEEKNIGIKETRIYKMNENSMTTQGITILKDTVENALRQPDSTLRLGISSYTNGKRVKLTDIYSGKQKSFANAAHSMLVVGSDENGIFVSTWDSKHYIKYEDILSNQNKISLYSGNLS